MNTLHVGAYGIILKESSLLLIRKARGPFKDLWDLPGGKIEHGEEIEHALYRELLEETGITLHDCVIFENLSNLVEFSDERGFISMHHIGLVYSITDYSQERQPEHTHDVKEVAWHHLSTVDKKILSPFAHEVIELLQAHTTISTIKLS